MTCGSSCDCEDCMAKNKRPVRRVHDIHVHIHDASETKHDPSNGQFTGGGGGSGKKRPSSPATNRSAHSEHAKYHAGRAAEEHDPSKKAAHNKASILHAKASSSGNGEASKEANIYGSTVKD